MDNSEAVMTKKKKKTGPWIVRLVQGAVVGVGGIIPGISGGVLCAIFGLYEPLMEVLAHPIKGLKKNFKLILPVVIGIAIGFLALAKVVDILFKSNEQIATALFTGLILGEMPSLWKEAGEHGERKRSSITSMCIAFALIFSAFIILECGTSVAIKPNSFWYAVSGVFLGLGVVVPGMSGSAPLTFLGLYGPMTGAISSAAENAIAFVTGKLSFSAALDAMQIWSVLFIGVGILIPFLLISRPIHFCLKHYPSQMYHTIFGVVAATTLPTIMFKIGWGELLVVKVGFVILGFVCAWLIDILSRKYSE